MTALHIDFETFSEVDLKKAGTSRYMRDRSTRVLCVAWGIDNGPVHSLIYPRAHDLEALFHEAGNDYVLHAWSAQFEVAVLAHKYGIMVPWEKVRCTQQRARYGGLPPELGMCGNALGLRTTKDMDGRRLMLKMCKPRDVTGRAWDKDPKEGKAMLAKLAEYCRKDVEAERAIADHIPPLPFAELKITALDRAANDYGVLLDRELIIRLRDIARAETKLLDREAAHLTQGAVTSPGTQTARLTEWFTRVGHLDLPSVDKEAISDALDVIDITMDVPEDVARMLVIRRNVAKSSTKKLEAMLAWMDTDDHARNLLEYYAARTGRWGGRGPQFQNLPKPMKGLDVKGAINAIRHLGLDHDGIRLFHGEPLAVVSSCLRGTLIPEPGHVLHVFDFSQIEARGLAWQAGQQDILDEFASGRDVYSYTAKNIGLASRDHGKVAVLGLGFGTGGEMFVEMARKAGITFSLEEAKQIVADWRAANAAIVQFWYALDGAVQSAMRIPGNAVDVACPIALSVRCTMARNGTALLTIRLPSGRFLYYRNARLVDDPDPLRRLQFPGRKVFYYDGIDPYTKQWGPIRMWGAKFTENVTQAIARDVMVASAMLVTETYKKVRLLLSVHDELVFQAPDIGEADNETVHQRLKKLVEMRCGWNTTMPVASEGKILTRYGKS